MQHPVNNKEILLKELSQHGTEIKSFGVARLGLFGSFAKDTQIRDSSDVDFIVEFKNGKKTFDKRKPS